MLNVLILINRYLPGFKSGGPVRSVEQIVAHLGEEIAFSILTIDRDTGDSVPYSNIQRSVWVECGNASTKYVSPQDCGFSAMSKAIKEHPHDVLYLNSFLSPQFSIGPMIARGLGHIPRKPVIIAPRGEFSPGALKTKATKKALFLQFARSSGFWRDVIWQASTAAEAEDIRAVLGPQAKHIRVASDLSQPVPKECPAFVPRAPGAPLRVLFLSRLTPKKNLSFALETLAGVKAPVQFSIVGPEEDIKYVKQCRSLASRLPKNISVTWTGAVRHEHLSEILTAHDLLFLPTWGENFGHVIAEAFSAGLPVLISDTTPWQGLAERKVGYDLPLDDIRAFRTAIETEAARTPDEALAMRLNVFAFARAREDRNENLAANRELFDF